MPLVDPAAAVHARAHLASNRAGSNQVWPAAMTVDYEDDFGVNAGLMVKAALQRNPPSASQGRTSAPLRTPTHCGVAQTCFQGMEQRHSLSKPARLGSLEHHVSRPMTFGARQSHREIFLCSPFRKLGGQPFRGEPPTRPGCPTSRISILCGNLPPGLPGVRLCRCRSSRDQVCDSQIMFRHDREYFVDRTNALRPLKRSDLLVQSGLPLQEFCK